MKDNMQRVNIRLPIDVHQWYKAEARSMGMNMSQYMAFVLVTHQRSQESANAIKTIADVAKESDVKETSKNLLEFMNQPEVKQAIKEMQRELLGKRR